MSAERLEEDSYFPIVGEQKGIPYWRIYCGAINRSAYEKVELC